VAVREPEPAQGACQRERTIGVGVAKPVEGGANVVVVELEPARPAGLVAETPGVGLLG
jgi:hypothetical protein